MFFFPKPITAWYQSIASEGVAQCYLIAKAQTSDKCNTRNSVIREAVLGIANIKGYLQAKATAFYSNYGCNRAHPDDYSLFVHWYDEPVGIQLLGLGIPGLEHFWSSYRRIDPDSREWIDNKNPHKGWYVPGPSGRSPAGQFYADLIATVPPGAIRFKVANTNEYITVEDAIYMPEKAPGGRPIIPDRELVGVERRTAEEVLKQQIIARYLGNLYYHTKEENERTRIRIQTRLAYVKAGKALIPDQGTPNLNAIRALIEMYPFPIRQAQGIWNADGNGQIESEASGNIVLGSNGGKSENPLFPSLYEESDEIDLAPTIMKCPDSKPLMVNNIDQENYNSQNINSLQQLSELPAPRHGRSHPQLSNRPAIPQNQNFNQLAGYVQQPRYSDQGNQDNYLSQIASGYLLANLPGPQSPDVNTLISQNPQQKQSGDLNNPSFQQRLENPHWRFSKPSGPWLRDSDSDSESIIWTEQYPNQFIHQYEPKLRRAMEEERFDHEQDYIQNFEWEMQLQNDMKEAETVAEVQRFLGGMQEEELTDDQFYRELREDIAQMPDTWGLMELEGT
ncbi:hypothetical protein ABW20_dc0107644 [Dactylellina cionopaga]|nr:hypothetical protein ABW20_dc0107644 [Dactylellina cionopaga]